MCVVGMRIDLVRNHHCIFSQNKQCMRNVASLGTVVLRCSGPSGSRLAARTRVWQHTVAAEVEKAVCEWLVLHECAVVSAGLRCTTWGVQCVTNVLLVFYLCFIGVLLANKTQIKHQ